MAGPRHIFDQTLLDTRRRRALARPHENADFLLRAAVDDLLDRIAVVKRDFAIAIDLGTPLALLTDRLSSMSQVKRVTRVDRLAETVPANGTGLVGDPELLPFRDGSLDLVASALALHWVADLPGCLAQIRRALKPDGLFIANLLGGETLHELRASLTIAEAELTGGASPRIAPFADLRDMGALLQRTGFALPVVDRDRLTVRYADALTLMHDLRAMGATNALVERARTPLRRDVLIRAVAIYSERFSDPDGRIRATFDIVSLSGWAPHESQQQPLRPGSAKSRLADALGVAERSAGEKTGGKSES
jgi:SAM-dependent methyltransferase